MTNIDLKKDLKHLYKPSPKTVTLVDVPPMNYLMIDGKGNPSTSPQYTNAIQSLYPLAYGIRAISKAQGITFTVMPLEGLWEFEGQEDKKDFVMTDAEKDTFEWTLMILQPDHITAEIVETARENVRKKKNPPALDAIRFERYHEESAVQILHIGSYADEGDNVQRLHETITNNNWQFAKKHHEIYLSDARKVAPEKLKTIIRQPYVTA